MGIYTNGNLFGIRIYTFNEHDDFANILFEEKYDEIMSHEQMREAYLFYTELNNKENILFKVYTECTTTLDIIDKGPFMTWYPIPLQFFIENFSI